MGQIPSSKDCWSLACPLPPQGLLSGCMSVLHRHTAILMTYSFFRAQADCRGHRPGHSARVHEHRPPGPGEGHLTSVEPDRGPSAEVSPLAHTSGSIALGQKDRWEPGISARHLMLTLLYVPKMLAWKRVLCCPSHGLILLHLLSPVQTLGSCVSTCSCC